MSDATVFVWLGCFLCVLCERVIATEHDDRDRKMEEKRR